MTHKETLVSLDVSRERQEKEKPIQTRQSVIDTDEVERDTGNLNQKKINLGELSL